MIDDEEENPVIAALVELIEARCPQGEAMDHPFRVASYAEDDDEVIVALAHDLIEDGYSTVEELYDLRLTPTQRDAVQFLTRDKRVPYEHYIGRIVMEIEDGHPAAVLAASVKLYDLFDHLFPNRVGNISVEKVKRYAQAIERIASALTLAAARSDGGAGDRVESAGVGV